MTIKETEELIKRVAILETEIAALKDLSEDIKMLRNMVYETKPELSILSQNQNNLSHRIDVHRQDIQNIQINDKKSQNQIFYMLIILFLTLIIRALTVNISILEPLKKLFGF